MSIVSASSSRAVKPSERPVRKSFLSLDAYTRHKILVNHYRLSYPGAADSFKRDTTKDKTDSDILHEYHQFLWSSEDEGEDGDHEEKRKEKQRKEDKDESWGKRLAKKYYEQLFKEYAICDLSRYQENKVALRWRLESEVIEGRGQFSCGEKHCQKVDGLKTWEVNFKYQEKGEVKNALVKLRLCSECSDKLNFHHKKKEVTREEDLTTLKSTEGKKKKHKKSKKRKRSNSSDDEDDIRRREKRIKEFLDQMFL